MYLTFQSAASATSYCLQMPRRFCICKFEWFSLELGNLPKIWSERRFEILRRPWDLFQLKSHWSLVSLSLYLFIYSFFYRIIMEHQNQFSVTTHSVLHVAWFVQPVTFVLGGAICMHLRKGQSTLEGCSNLRQRYKTFSV